MLLFAAAAAAAFNGLFFVFIYNSKNASSHSCFSFFPVNQFLQLCMFCPTQLREVCARLVAGLFSLTALKRCGLYYYSVLIHSFYSVIYTPTEMVY